MQESGSWRIPRFDRRVSRWRTTTGHFMKFGVPLGGWVLVRCEHCGRDFPTRDWKADERPALFVCSFDCLAERNLVRRKHMPLDSDRK